MKIEKKSKLIIKKTAAFSVSVSVSLSTNFSYHKKQAIELCVFPKHDESNQLKKKQAVKFIVTLSV